MNRRRSETAPQEVAEVQVSPFPFFFLSPNTINLLYLKDLSFFNIYNFIDDLRSPYPLGFALFQPIILHATFYSPMEFGHVCSLRNHIPRCPPRNSAPHPLLLADFDWRTPLGPSLLTELSPHTSSWAFDFGSEWYLSLLRSKVKVRHADFTCVVLGPIYIKRPRFYVQNLRKMKMTRFQRHTQYICHDERTEYTLPPTKAQSLDEQGKQGHSPR